MDRTEQNCISGCTFARMQDSLSRLPKTPSNLCWRAHLASGFSSRRESASPEPEREWEKLSPADSYVLVSCESCAASKAELSCRGADA